MTEHIYTDQVKQIYGGDPREMPLYGLTETSRYLKIHLQTLKSWIYGRPYKLQDGTPKWWSPVIQLPDPSLPSLSFYNLVEVHVLCGIRRIHNIHFSKIRFALEYLEKHHPEKNPLAKQEFWTDRFDIFIKEFDYYVSLSQHGQQVIKEVIEQYLQRVDRDVNLSPFRLYPFAMKKVLPKHPKDLQDVPKNIVIDPLVSFGRPTLVGTGVPTNVIAGRFRAGEKLNALAEDYEIEAARIQEALDYEGVSLAAA